MSWSLGLSDKDYKAAAIKIYKFPQKQTKIRHSQGVKVVSSRIQASSLNCNGKEIDVFKKQSQEMLETDRSSPKDQH